MPNTLPSNIPKFEGNPREDHINYVRSFHMWHSSNSIIEDTIRLRLFQCMPTRDVAKWYVDKPESTHSNFVTLAKYFFTYFQLPLYYDTSTELLASFCQTSATRLSNHVHESHRRRSIYRSPEFKDCVYMD